MTDLTGRRILAIGTRGDQGSGLVDAITDAGATAVLASSRGEQVATWHAEGRDAVVLDLSRPDEVADVATGAHAWGAVTHMPLSMGPDAPRAGHSAAALAQAGVRTVVNLGTVIPPVGEPDPFGVRATVAALDGTGVTLLGVTAYLENLAAPWSLDALADGVLRYPRPADDPIAWITARDVTRAGVAALDHPGGATHQLAGPDSLTFAELAAELAEGLDRPIVFQRVTPAEFAASARPYLGGAAAGVEQAYASMPEKPNPLMAPDASAAWEALGVTPTTAREWAAAVVAPHLR